MNKYIYNVRFVTLQLYINMNFWQTTFGKQQTVIISTTEKMIANKIMK